MSFLSLFQRSYFLGTIFTLCGLFLLSGCQQAPDQSYTSVLVSKKGIEVERFLPTETIFFVKAGASSESQQKNLQQLLQHFPQEDQKALWDSIATSFNEYFKNENLTFEKDVLPAVGDNIQAAMAITKITVEQGEEEYVKKSVPMDMLVFIPLVEAEQFAKVLDSALIQSGFEKTQYNNVPLYGKNKESSSETYMALYEDILVIGNNKSEIQAALDRVSKKETSLIEQENYQKTVTALKDSIGIMYMDMPIFIKEMRKISTYQSMYQTGNTTQQMVTPAYTEIIKSEAISISAENDGLRFYGKALINEEKAKELHIDPQDLASGAAYLYKKIPAEKVIYYGEAYNIKKVLELNATAYEQMEGFKEGLQNLKFFLALQGIDAEKDLLAFMDKGFAFVIREGYWLVPGIDLYIDAGSQPEGAEKVMEKIHNAINTYFLNQNAADPVEELQPKLSEMFLNEKVSDNNYRFSFNFSKIPSEELTTIPKEIVEKGIQITYGVNNDNLLYISFIPATTTKTLADDETFKKAQEFVKGMENGIGYINPGEISRYLNLVQIMIEEKGPMPPETKTVFEKAKAYLTPFKSLIFASGAVKGSEMEIGGFLHIAK